MNTPRRKLLGAVGALSCATVLITGCSQVDGQDPDTETVTTTEENVSPSPSAPDESDSAEGSSVPSNDNCGESDVHDTFNGDSPIPVYFANMPSETGYFHYSISDDSVDPCLPLSWVVLNGGLGDAESSNGTAGSSGQTVALFAYGQLITEPAPILARTIDEVERIDDSTIRVTYAFLGDAPATANQTEPGSATFSWDGNQIEVSDNTIPVDLNETAATLDLTSL